MVAVSGYPYRLTAGLPVSWLQGWAGCILVFSVM